MECLKKTFRWFGPSFGVSLGEIKHFESMDKADAHRLEKRFGGGGS